MDVKAVREHQRFALCHVRRDLVAVHFSLQVIRQKNHGDVRCFRRLRYRQHGKADGFRLRFALASFVQPD